MKPSAVDLFELRCAIAVLLHACDHIDDLSTTNLVRLDNAVRHISRFRSQMNGDFAANTDALLSTDLDPAGRRTIDAIGQLAELVQITESTALALAEAFPPTGDTDSAPRLAGIRHASGRTVASGGAIAPDSRPPFGRYRAPVSG